MKKSAAYLKVVEWSDEDNCYVGSAPPLIGPCCHGRDEAAVYRKLCRIVDEWIAIHEADGRPLPPPTFPVGKRYSGRFVVRIDPALHKALVLRSVQARTSLNSVVADALRTAI